MKKVIFFVTLMGMLMSMNISYAIMAPPGFGLRYILNSGMSIVVKTIDLNIPPWLTFIGFNLVNSLFDKVNFL